ncbi:MAG: hypothetical protein H8E81_05905 [Deltaproteobacteria bacterium]|nr:hypothetical protein [Deltaproteobacteria bacterium]
MVIDGVITSDTVANGTPSLSEDEKLKLSDAYQGLKMEIEETCPANWVSKKTI